MITIKDREYTSGYTHDGKFHSDEVATTALLRILDPEFPVVRGHYPPAGNDEVLVYDIGGGPYDHHFAVKERRPNMIEYSSVGLVWRDIRDQFDLSHEQQNQFDYCIVQPIDLSDNTGMPNPFSALMGSMNLNWNEDSAFADKHFFAAVNLCKTLFLNWFIRARAEAEAVDFAKTIAVNSPKGIAICEKYVPVESFPKNVKLIISPSQRGGWQALTRKGNGILFPENWRGSRNLPEGVTFCHPGGFIACFDTEKNALQYCQELIA